MIIHEYFLLTVDYLPKNTVHKEIYRLLQHGGFVLDTNYPLNVSVGVNYPVHLRVDSLNLTCSIAANPLTDNYKWC